MILKNMNNFVDNKEDQSISSGIKYFNYVHSKNVYKSPTLECLGPLIKKTMGSGGSGVDAFSPNDPFSP